MYQIDPQPFLSLSYPILYENFWLLFACEADHLVTEAWSQLHSASCSGVENQLNDNNAFKCNFAAALQFSRETI